MAGKTPLTNAALAVLYLSLLVSCKNQKESSPLLSFKTLAHYPSGSAVEYLNGRFFVMGDDATYLLELNESLDSVGKIDLYEHPERRMPKESKPDLESITLLSTNDTPYIFLAGSGSFDPYRNSGWLINTANREKQEIRLDSFFRKLRADSIPELNIEGMAATSKELILVNRGNKSRPVNHMVVTGNEIEKIRASPSVRIIPLAGGNDTTDFSGVSGIDYSARYDRLVMTVSTEDTYNAYEDGAIGKSYIWIIDKFSSKRNVRTIQADHAIELDALDKNLALQKIESVCIVSESEHEIVLVLVADNDDGMTRLFKIKLEV